MSVNNNSLPHGGAYEGFPDGPESYRAASADATLGKLFRSAVKHAQDRIDWYDRKAAELKGPARSLRGMALFLFAVGTILPILSGLVLKLYGTYGNPNAPSKDWTWADHLAKWPMAETGYIFLALAGALVIFDQFFDHSGSWMRFRQSQARLEVLLADLRFGWAELLTKCGGVIDDHPTATAFVTLLRGFVTKVEQLAEAETREWAERFRAQINAFDNNPSLKLRLDSKEDREQEVANNAAGGGDAPPDGGPPTTPSGGPPGQAAAPTLVHVRLAIEGTDGLDPGSLRLLLDEAQLPVPGDSMLEVPLEVGVVHHFAAVATRAGQAVTGRLEITPTPEDDGKPLALELA